MKDIILIGYGGHAKSIADAIEQDGKFHIVGYTDVRPSDDRDYEWLGTDDRLEEYHKAGIENVVISIGYMGQSRIRDKVYRSVKKIGYQLPVIIDKSAVIAKDVYIGEGTFIGKGAIVNVSSQIGKMCIINSGALIEHENIIGDFSHIAVKAVLCGQVQIGEHVLIGANATVIQGVQIEEECIVGAGSIVLKNLSRQKTVYGVCK